MKKLFSLMVLMMSLVLISCNGFLDNPLNVKDFEKVKEYVNNDKSMEDAEKKFIIDDLSVSVGLLGVGKLLGGNDVEIKTYGERIDELRVDYQNNKKLDKFITLMDANTTSISKYKGYLTMNLKFNDVFDKPIHYIVIRYKYVNEYDSEFFSEKVKITNKITNNFKGVSDISTLEEYNDVATFIYKKVPVQASLKLREELGEENANKKVHRDFLMKGLKVETVGIVFKDKTELIRI